MKRLIVVVQCGMSHEFSSSPLKDFLETLNADKKNFLYGFINLDQPNLEIGWDLDQTLAISENPVKLAVDKRFSEKHGIKYSSRRTDGWDSISKWLLEDRIFKTFDEANAYESYLWTNPEILFQAPPNEALRALSYVAWQKGIPQSITTVRVPGLRQATYKWIDQYYWWIGAGNVNFNLNLHIPGRAFKVGSILEDYDRNPGLIHVDDDLTIIQPLAEKAPNLGLIGIRYPSDNVDGLNGVPNRIFIERDLLSSMIPYNPNIVR